ncbi:MAG: tetratricopeptide repeat protein [Lewinellaceae bacterium]|nr:tetratricopeptide repeat protein [Saprospiraceae bacterium]MCB9337907.1 tetratricopeptide repeat protein [Lewinellaceae bacterium]
MRKLLLICTAFIPFGLLAQPRDAEGSYSLEAENFYQQATQAHDAGDLETAAAFYAESIWADSTHLKALYNLALVQYEMGQYGKAELTLEKLLKATPWDTDAYELYGLALYQRGQYDRAIASFSAAMKTSAPARLLTDRGLAFSASGQYRAALLDFDDALRMEPDNVIACSAKGATLSKLGQYRLAMDWFDQALALQPNDVPSLINRATARYEMGETAQAENDFNLAIGYGGESEAYLARARCRLVGGQPEAALQDVKKAMRLDASNPEVYYLLGETEMAKGEAAAAIESFTIALDFNPSCPDCYFGRGKAKVQNRQFYEAINDLYRVLELDPLHQEAKAMLPEIYGLLDTENMQWMAGKER